MQQPLHCTLCGRGRDWFFLVSRRRVIDNDFSVARYIRFKIAQKTRHFLRGHGGRGRIGDRTFERYQRFANQIEAPSDLTVPQAPTDPIDCFRQRGSGLAMTRRSVGPTLGRLINMLDPHCKMKPIQHMFGWAKTGRFAQCAWALCPIAENRDRCVSRRAQFVKDAAQLGLLRNGLRRHAAEYDLLAFVIADLSEQNFERAHLVLANRSYMAAIDGKRN